MNRLPARILGRLVTRFGKRFGLTLPKDVVSLEDLLIWGIEQAIPWDEILDTIFGPEEEPPTVEDPTAPSEAGDGSGSEPSPAAIR